MDHRDRREALVAQLLAVDEKLYDFVLPAAGHHVGKSTMITLKALRSRLKCSHGLSNIKSEITRSGDEVKLSAREWAVPRTFLKYVGMVVSHRMLLHQAWGPEYEGEGDYVRTYVTRLGKNTRARAQDLRYIVTERGIGYRLVSPSGRFKAENRVGVAGCAI